MALTITKRAFAPSENSQTIEFPNVPNFKSVQQEPGGDFCLYAEYTELPPPSTFAFQAKICCISNEDAVPGVAQTYLGSVQTEGGTRHVYWVLA